MEEEAGQAAFYDGAVLALDDIAAAVEEVMDMLEGE